MRTLARVAKSFLVPDTYRDMRLLLKSRMDAFEAECPCCGFHGQFRGFGSPIRLGVLCPSCGSVERHRLLTLAIDRGLIDLSGRDILHFAPEQWLKGRLERAGAGKYVTSNYPLQEGADFCFDIEAIDLPDESYDIIMCFHVLEHVDDRRALSELYRVLRAGGKLVAMVPIIEGWDASYEDSALTTERQRHIHFGQYDHVRYYGADFRDRVTQAGFQLVEFTANGPDSPRYRLKRGEKVFIATKPEE
jgi:SAM-dependent methyltransferase